MLTFYFSGAEGIMTVPDRLTSGMIGRHVRFEFSPDWEGLRRTAVYMAGDVCRIHTDVGEVDTIPAEVLETPMRKLYVGIYGTSADGTVAVPTVRAEGPEIRPGVAPEGDPATDPSLPVWAQLLAMLGAPEDLQTEAKDSLVAAINEALRAGISPGAAELLITILRSGVYISDQSAQITALSAALDLASEDNGEALQAWTVTSSLTNVTASNTSGYTLAGGAYTSVLTADEGYTLDYVRITMGGVDITNTVLAGGTIHIPAVTGDIVITATAAKDSESGGETGDPVAGYAVTYQLTNMVSDSANGYTTAQAPYSAALTPAEGYEIGSITVTMDAVDISAEAVSEGLIYIPSVTGDVVITALGAKIIEKGQLLCSWDFTHGLTDSVSGAAATVDGAEQTEDGMVFDAAVDNVALGEVFGFGKILEIDIASCSKTDTSVNGVVFWTNPGINYGFAWNKTAQRFGFYADSTGWHNDSEEKDVNYLNGCTLTVTADGEGNVHIYKDRIEFQFSKVVCFQSEDNLKYITLGSTKSTYPALFDSVITGVRIYEGVTE